MYILGYTVQLIEKYQHAIATLYINKPYATVQDVLFVRLYRDN